jgi:hypothetical protein
MPHLHGLLGLSRGALSPEGLFRAGLPEMSHLAVED